MTDRFALWLPIAVLAMLAVLTFWIQQTVKEAAIRDINEAEPDSIVENFLAVSTDADGVPRYRLSADKLSHFSGNKLTLLDNPEFTHLHAKQGEMRISSKTANVSPEEDKVVFNGNVRLLRPGDGARKEMSMLTSRLEVFTKKNEALTQEPVVIQQPGMKITANGLHLFADTRVLKLNGRVKAQYHHANRV